MSRSNPTAEKMSNPCKNWLTWDSTNKRFNKWDKEADNPESKTGKGKNIPYPLPFQFLVLDTLTTITGHNKASNKPIICNEVRVWQDSKDGKEKAQEMVIRVNGAEMARGKYHDIVGKVQGAKFATSVYIAFFDSNKQLVLGNMKLDGSAVGAWIEKSDELKKQNKKIETCAFRVATTKEGKNGNVTYNAPVFEEITVKPETDAKAVELDKLLQEYLQEYLTNPSVTNSNVNPPEASNEANEPAQSATPITDSFAEEMNAPVVNTSFDDEAF